MSEDAIKKALNFASAGRARMIPAQIYAAAGNSPRDVDFSRWFLTGPQDRPGYLQGPFAQDVVLELAHQKMIIPDVTDRYGRVIAYIHPSFAHLRAEGR